MFLRQLNQVGLIATVSAYMLTTIPLLLGVIFVLQHVYLRTSRQMRLLDLEAKSPLYTHFLETLNGLATIRAFDWQDDSRHANHRLLDIAQRPDYLLLCIQRWLNLVLGLTVGAEGVIVVALALALRSTTSPGLLGISMNNVIGTSTQYHSFILQGKQGW